MASSLLINVAFLISFISLGAQIQRRHNLSYSPSHTFNKLFYGVFTGCLGITLMLFSIKINPNTILDFRYIALIISCVFGGSTSAIICGILIASFRIIYYGLNTSSVVGAIIIIALILVYLVIIKLRLSNYKKWFISTLFAVILSSLGFILILYKSSNLLNLLFIYIISITLISIISFYYLCFCIKANELFQKLQYESTKDFLTSLNNVREFDNLFNIAVKNTLEKKQKLSLLMIDIDLFKKVNDTYGHQEGDRVLMELSKILLQSCRGCDIVSRNGGEEFTVLLIDCPKSFALQIAEKIRINVESHPFILPNDKMFNITVSIGVSSYPETTNEINKLCENSDIALYTAKRTGRNKVFSV